MNKYLIIILFSSIVLSDNYDIQTSNRYRYDFNARENYIKINNYRDEDELLQFIESIMETHLTLSCYNRERPVMPITERA